MAVLTLTQMLAEARYQNGDSDSANYAYDDTALTAFLNRAYIAVKGMQDDRTQFLSATTSGASATAANLGIVQTTAVNIRRIVRLFITSGAATTTPTAGALERWEPWRVWKERAESATTGEPTAFSAVRQGNATAASVGKWLLVFWRIPDATYDYVMEAVLEPTALSGGTDKPDVDDQTSYAIAWMAAAFSARMMGRSAEFVAHIEAMIPGTLKAAYAQMQDDKLDMVTP